jgi:hypothetical protein
LVASRACKFKKEGGEPCRAPPLHDAEFCFAHDPEHAEEMAEARRLGGLRRRREHAVAGAFEIEGLEDVSQLRRVLTIATLDLLGLDNSIARARALIAVVGSGAKLLEVGELEERLRSLEATMAPRTPAKKGRGR